MNFRKLTSRYFGWCSGIDSALKFIPDKDISDQWIVYSFASLSAIVVILGLRSYLMFFNNYQWDIDFHDSEYDEIYSMYVEKRSGDFFGIYMINIDVVAPQNTTCQIQLHQRYEGELCSLWAYRNGYYFWNLNPKTSFNTTMDLHNPYIFIFNSDSTETNIPIDIKYLRKDPSFP